MTGGNGDLPDGWVTTILEDICLHVNKVTPGHTPNKPFTYLDIASIDNRTFRVVSPKSYLGKDAPSRARQKVSGGDTLFSTVRTYLKNIAMVPPEFDGEVASTGFCVLHPADEISHRFIFYFVLNDEFVSTLNPLQRGTSYPAVRDADVLSQEVPLPPLPEQHRIVAEIEKQFTRLDASVAALKRVQSNLKRHRASVLKAACEGTLVPTEAELADSEGRDYEPAGRLLERILAERRSRWESQEKRRGKYKEPAAPDTSNLPELPEGWVWATVGQLVVDSPQNGIYKPKSRYGDGVPILRIEDYQDFSLRDREQLQLLRITTQEAFTYGLAASQLIINRVNSSTHLGKTLLVPDHLPPAVFESNMMRVIPTKCMEPSFLAHYLRSPIGRARLTTRAKWAVNQASINQSDVCMTPVPLSPHAEQHRIVAEVERRLSVIQQAEAAVEANLVRAERLRQSILKQAFSGKLVPQDPNDEPASVLLEHIRAEREAAQAAAKPKRRARRRGAGPSPERQLVLGDQEEAP